MKIKGTFNQLIFKAGLTTQIRKEISDCDIKEIEETFLKNGIKTNFKDNQVIAWCSLKSFEIIKFSNKKYKLDFDLPNGIFVEDFDSLNICNKNASGLLNFAPTRLYKEKPIIIPEKTIFFNEFKKLNSFKGNEFWTNIDIFADHNFEKKYSSTNFFLEPILHEFLHSAHEGNLIKKLGGECMLKKIQKYLSPENTNIFREKYHPILKNICSCASTNPLETIAFDLSKRIIQNLNLESLLPTKNFIKESPYKNKCIFEYFFQDEEQLSKLIRKIWNGKF